MYVCMYVYSLYVYLFYWHVLSCVIQIKEWNLYLWMFFDDVKYITNYSQLAVVIFIAQKFNIL